MRAALVAGLLLAGCASSDMVQIRRGDLALLYADTKADVAVAVDRMAPRCQTPKTAQEATRCAEFRETVDKLKAREQLIRTMIQDESSGLTRADVGEFLRLGLRVAALAAL